MTIALLVLGFNYYVHFPLAQNAEQRELRTLSTLLDGYARQVEEQMIGVETTLTALGSIANDNRYSAREKHLLLKQAADALDIVRVFGITDINGRIIHSSRTFPAPDVDLSERDYVQFFLSGGEAQRFLSGPVKNLVDGRWQISLSRAIRAPSGELVGVISTVIDPGTMIDRIAQSANEVDYVTLLDRNFNLVARQPAKEEMIGKSMANAEIYTDVANSPDGHVAEIYANVFTGQVRFGVGERVFHDSLVISTSRPYEYAMQYWQVFASGMTIASIVVMVFMVAILWFIHLRGIATQRYNEKLKTINSELEIAKSDAERLANIKDDFLANMSHEIRTPMNAIFGLTQLLKRTPLEEQQKEYVRQIGLSGKFLLGVIDEILTFSKIEANELILDSEPFVLPDVIDNVGSIMSMSVNDKPVETVIKVAPDVPRSVVGDSHRLQQILVNLISNAIKFTESGYVRLEVRKEASDEKSDQICFSVVDSGIGIPEAQQQSIFDPFTQADASTTRKFGGTGLGLAISNRLALAMGGNITLQSQPGKGSTFTLKVPLKDGPSHIAPPLKFDDEHQNIRVLIVDDHAQTREALQAIAQSLFVDADTAENGKSAIDMLVNATKPYDILMIDWQMPELDGLQTIKRLPESKLVKMPSIIMVTAYERELLSQTADGHEYELLTKPVTGSSFFNAITAVSGASSAIRPGSPSARNMANETLDGYEILVAEDNPINQKVAKDLLCSLGANVHLAVNGVEAVAAIENGKFDIVLMDVQMPEMTGIEATQRIRATYPELELPIIALTAGVLENEQQKCREAGMNDFVGKPFDFELIVSKIVQHAPRALSAIDFEPTAQPDDLAGATTYQKSLKDGSHNDWADAPLHDESKVHGLTAGNMDLYDHLCRLFEPQARDCQLKIRQALKERDANTLGEQFHIMKGSSAQIAASRITVASGDLERLSNANDLDAVAELLERFDIVIEETLSVLRTLQQRA
ncbi:response regulator [Thalassospira sp. A40-3]|uniref:response regulator n=1 Tax=Thalassospira sp. A40-3 TaxID=2785908 RepID=UPI0018CDFAEC|nr:response regulator [Thalassospira sp. A40-3]QPO12908.1 response regulator [Thalassospira sp. A40-3]